MSVKQLRDHVQALSVDIDRQRRVLKKLEGDKIIALRQLNAILDPVTWLPLEISSEIFVQSLPPVPEPGATPIPLLFLNICHSWSHIALSTPALWATIHVEFPRPEGFDHGLEDWLERARNRPLSISLRGSFDDDVATVIREHAEQLKRLKIFHDGEDETDIDDPLRGIGPGPFPLLESLTIGSENINEDNEYISFDLSSTLDVFHLTPNLVECTFDMVRGMTDRTLTPRAPVVLPNLCQLKFGSSEDYLESHSTIMQYLTLPGLRTLFLSMRGISGDDLIAFLKRSSPPLRNLVINEQFFLSSPILEQCLRLLPTVTHLELSNPHGILVQGLFTALADSPSSLLPHLQSLRIPFYMDLNPQPAWVALQRALSARRTHFTSVNIVVNGGRSWGLDADICAAFRQLVEDGMEIYIGDHNKNFLSA
ncbi:hypothetical protein DFH07DRAFT_459229 [Mycena maculata]|uniref:F-box domain-containing protein n=1 Tax=Mycena maculata TaxID=230809 RepID=A0AAD7NFL9_9AGAR|nr:hypothetical protein DFH07DRAFT_459229 [Mycena maculata]